MALTLIDCVGGKDNELEILPNPFRPGRSWDFGDDEIALDSDAACGEAGDCFAHGGSGWPTDYAHGEQGTYACEATPIAARFVIAPLTFTTGATALVTDEHGSGVGDISATLMSIWSGVALHWDTRAGVDVTMDFSTDSLLTSRAEDSTQTITMYVGSNADYAAMTFCKRRVNLPCAHDYCDIVFYTQFANGDPIKWATPLAATGAYMSLPQVSKHEIGHALGLGEQNGSTFPLSIMQDEIASSPLITGPNSEDLSAVRDIYGVP